MRLRLAVAAVVEGKVIHQVTLTAATASKV
jgi:hypothetical protein